MCERSVSIFIKNHRSFIGLYHRGSVNTMKQETPLDRFVRALAERHNGVHTSPVHTSEISKDNEPHTCVNTPTNHDHTSRKEKLSGSTATEVGPCRLCYWEDSTGVIHEGYSILLGRTREWDGTERFWICVPDTLNEDDHSGRWVR